MQKDLLHLFPLMSPSQSARGKAALPLEVEMDGRTKHVLRKNTNKTKQNKTKQKNWQKN